MGVLSTRRATDPRVSRGNVSVISLFRVYLDELLRSYGNLPLIHLEFEGLELDRRELDKQEVEQPEVDRLLTLMNRGLVVAEIVADSVVIYLDYLIVVFDQVAYKLELPEKLSSVHNTFHISNLKKCLSDESLVIPMKELHLDDKLNFVEEPVEVMDREIKQLKRSRIPIIKVRWNSKRGPEFTWEREDEIPC
ncbi:hypothetical protein Tco_1336838 [Tanacetum coccineum]